MQHPEEAAAEAEAEGDGALRLEGERGVVELQFLQRVAQVGVFAAVLGVDAAVDHRPRLLIAGQGLGCGARGLRHRVSHARVRHVLDAGREIAHVPGGELLTGLQARGAQVADLDDLVHRAGGHELDVHVLLYPPVEEAEQDDDAAEGVVLAVEDERAERGVRVALRGRYAADYRLRHGGDVDAVLGRDLRRVLGRYAYYVLDLLFCARHVRRRQVDLVYHRQYLQVVVQRHIGVGQGLRLHALARVHHQQRALAGGQRAADLIAEVHVPRRVDEVERVLLAVLRLVCEAHGAGLYRYAALALEVHIVEYLALHLPLVHRAAELDQPVGERALAVVDVRDDRKVPDVLPVRHFPPSASFSALSAMARRPDASERSSPMSARAASSVLPSR